MRWVAGGQNCASAVKRSWSKCLKALFKASALAGKIPQEVQPGAADLGMPLDNNLINAWGAQQEVSFDADTVASDAPHGKGGVIATAAYIENGAFKDLDPFPVALFDLEVDGNRVTREQFRNIFIDRCFN